MWVYKAAYEKFGARMCWGSDYPPALFHMTYRQSLEAFRAHCDFVSPGDREAILGGTLKRLLDSARPVR
jgi:predicted TIM-barrel fold metal-dependent hydrolase